MNLKEYIENCIEALPREEQKDAREAFEAVGGIGDGSLIGKLLVVMRANNAYADRIPSQLKEVSEFLLSDLDEWRKRDISERLSEKMNLENQLRSIIQDQLPTLAKSLSVTRLAEDLENQGCLLGRLEHAVLTMRHFRVGGLLLLMGLSAFFGAFLMGAIFYQPYTKGQTAVTNWNYYERRGISISGSDGENSVVVSIDGSELSPDGLTLKKDNQGRTIGADLVFTR